MPVLEDGVGHDRWRHAKRLAHVEVVPALPAAPAEIRAPSGKRSVREVDLLPEVLADVGDREVARGTIEGEPPRISQAVGPDLVAPRLVDEWIVGRNRVRLAGRTQLGVDAQHLSAQVFEILAGLERIASPATVACRGVEVAVRAELELASVVVPVSRMGNLDHDPPRARIGDVRIDLVSEVFRDLDVALRVGVVHVELPIRRVVRVERDREEPALTPGRDSCDGQKRGRQQLVVQEQPNRCACASALLDDERPLLVTGRRGHVDRRVDGCDGLQGERQRGRRRRAASAGEQRSHAQRHSQPEQGSPGPPHPFRRISPTPE